MPQRALSLVCSSDVANGFGSYPTCLFRQRLLKTLVANSETRLRLAVLELEEERARLLVLLLLAGASLLLLLLGIATLTALVIVLFLGHVSSHGHQRECWCTDCTQRTTRRNSTFVKPSVIRCSKKTLKQLAADRGLLEVNEDDPSR